MNSLIAVDSLDVLILGDNVVDSLSSIPSYVESEWTRLWARGLSSISGRCLCCAAHGLSCAISVRFSDSERTLLFDTGPDEAVFERNVDRLGFDMGSIDGVVLSHGHWDHAGPMVRALDMIQLKNRGRPVPTFMHPGMYRPRAVSSAVGYAATARPRWRRLGARQAASSGPQIRRPTKPSGANGQERTAAALARFSRNQSLTTSTSVGF